MFLLEIRFDFDDLLWCFGPENSGPNVLVDQTIGTQYLSEIRDSLDSTLQWVAKEGV